MSRDDLVNADYIDSRDVTERIEDLEALDTLDEDEQDELAWLREFAAQGSDATDWQYGETFIRDDQFEDYARQLAEDIGAIDRDAAWPLTYIDWPAATDALRMDYSEIDVRGTSYLYHS